MKGITDLSGANLQGTDLTKANLKGVDLSGAELQNTTLDSAILQGANLQGASMTSAKLNSANLQRANLEGATLTEAELKYAKLSEANITEAKLQKANFRGANMSKACLKHAELNAGTSFVEANLSGAVFSGTTMETIPQFGRSILNNVALPYPPAGFRPLLTLAKEISQKAQKVHLWLAGFYILMVWTVMSASNVQNLIMGSQVTISLLGTNATLDISLFLFIGPLLGLLIFVYFHIDITSIWELVSDLPSKFTDQLPMRRKLHPWIFNALLDWWHTPDILGNDEADIHTSNDGKPQDPTQTLIKYLRIMISIFLGWILFPLTLFIAMLFYLRNLGLYKDAYVLAIFFIFSVVFAAFFYERAKSVVKIIDLNWTKVIAWSIVAIILAIVPRYVLGGSNWQHNQPLQLRNVDFINPNFHQPILENRLFNADLTLSKLINADLSNRILSCANLNGADLTHADLNKAKLCGADLTGAQLSQATLNRAILSDSDPSCFSKLKPACPSANSSDNKPSHIPTKLDDANLQHARLEHANLQNASLGRANLQKARLYEANLQKAIFIGANLQKALLVKANLSRARLERADLREARLDGANLEGAILIEANLQGVTFSSWDDPKSRPTIATLKGTRLDGADLRNARLNQVHFDDVELYGANLRGADFRGATGLSVSQVKAAFNWEQAYYSKDLCEQLQLPENHNQKLRYELSTKKDNS